MSYSDQLLEEYKETVADLTAERDEARERADLAERNREASLALRDETDVELMEARRLIGEFADAENRVASPGRMQETVAALLAYAAKHAGEGGGR